MTVAINLTVDDAHDAATGLRVLADYFEAKDHVAADAIAVHLGIPVSADTTEVQDDLRRWATALHNAREVVS